MTQGRPARHPGQAKVDLKTSLDGYRARAGVFRILDVPEALRADPARRPYDAEAEVLHQMHERFIPDSGLQMTSHHHEIYRSDARRTAPARLRLRRALVDSCPRLPSVLGWNHGTTSHRGGVA